MTTTPSVEAIETAAREHVRTQDPLDYDHARDRAEDSFAAGASWAITQMAASAPDAAAVLAVLSRHQPDFDFPSVCTGCRDGWSVQHQTDLIMAPLTELPVAADVWDDGYDRAESDRHGTGFWARGMRGNPYGNRRRD